MVVDVLLPALNEEEALPLVLAEIPWSEVRRAVVVDNGSTDRTAAVALGAGAEVVHQPERGYGAACLRGLEHLAQDPPDVVAFLDADHSDYPADLGLLLEPIRERGVDLVVGSRTRGHRQRGALTPQQIVGNAIACRGLRLFYGARYTDLGPFRAIRWSSLVGLGMADRTYGWTIEMQIKAAKLGLRTEEVPVRYRPRIGTSKVSGTLRGTLGASRKILGAFVRYAG
ncbi:MAG: glycosyltransferase family 2 protein [Myxococcales bacterium]|nr:glycosyltransferase family 2 protein [Myxococcales bacterium]